MKKFIASTQFILGFLLGLFAMYCSITGKLNTSADAEIFIFSLGFILTTFGFYAAVKTLVEKS